MNILDNIKILKSLSDKDRENLCFFSQERFLKKWEVLFKEWDSANAMYLLSKWVIEVYKTINTKVIKLWEVNAEDILGEMALFWKKEKRSASAKAKEDSVVIVLLSFSIKEITKNNPELVEKIKNIIIKREKENKKILSF